jgi:Uma2 family endonuclease
MLLPLYCAKHVVTSQGMSKDTPIPAEWLPQYTYKDYEKWEGDWELIRGFPYAMSPAPHRMHQYIGGQFVYAAIDALNRNKTSCPCEVLYESDWIIDDLTIVRPDVMILCNTPPSDFVRTPPVLILEIFSQATRLKDRNLKFKLYEENGVKYYLMADPERNNLEVFVLKNNRFEETTGTTFQLSDNCTVDLNLKNIWPK